MADGSITIAALLDTGAFQTSVTALERQLGGLSQRMQAAVAAAVKAAAETAAATPNSLQAKHRDPSPNC